jgi:ABC-type branched-subunit amino acid transport system substrate-binding protein
MIALILIAVLYLSVPSIVDALFNESLIQAPVALLVGDFSDEGFGSLVGSGVYAAERENSTSKQIAIQQVPVNEAAWRDAFGGANTEELDREIQALRSKLIREITDHNVVAIISANTSQTAPTVLQVAKTFHIPVLITVATNTDIIKDYDDVALRLIARDSKQAEAISEWCATQGERIGLIYDLTRYGTGLRDALTERVGPDRLIPFSVNTTTDLAGILMYGKTSEVRSWVIVGYRNQAIEFYSKKVSSKHAGSMLFTDGAYGKWLSQLSSDPTNSQQVFLSFPSVPKPGPSSQQQGTELRGYATLGFDAYYLISSGITTLDGVGNGQKHRLAQAIRDVATHPSNPVRTKQSYKFDSRGENEYASFAVTEVRHGLLP